LVTITNLVEGAPGPLQLGTGDINSRSSRQITPGKSPSVHRSLTRHSRLRPQPNATAPPFSLISSPPQVVAYNSLLPAHNRNRRASAERNSTRQVCPLLFKGKFEGHFEEKMQRPSLSCIAMRYKKGDKSQKPPVSHLLPRFCGELICNEYFAATPTP
jgi:hypothetical protein